MLGDNVHGDGHRLAQKRGREPANKASYAAAVSVQEGARDLVRGDVQLTGYQPKGAGYESFVQAANTFVFENGSERVQGSAVHCLTFLHKQSRLYQIEGVDEAS